MRTGFLLGAGSSFDAGLPLSNQLAEILVRQINETTDREANEVRGALNFVYGAMIAHASNAGNDPLAAVNVEKLFSAVRLLRSKSTHEAAAFVDTWKPAIAHFDSSRSRITDRDLARAIDASTGRGPFGTDLVSMIGEIAMSGVRPGDGTVFKKLNDQLMVRTSAILGNIRSVDYLEPIIQLARQQVDGLDIATLNYDLTIETAADNGSVSLTTGIEDWRPGTEIQLQTRPEHINLLKLHGSVDWTRERSEENPDFRQVDSYDIRRVPAGSPNTRPVMVIGDREKLETEGPTLALLAAFEKMLRRTDRLIVVGYSFADEHINRLVRAWLNLEPQRNIVVLDPGWPMPAYARDMLEDDFRFQLQRLATIADYPRGRASPIVRPLRVRVVREGASSGLSAALDIDSRPAEMRIQAVLCLDDTPNPILRLTNRGMPLAEVNLTVYKPMTSYSSQAIRWLSGSSSFPETRGIAESASHTQFFDTGDVIEVGLLLNERRSETLGSLRLRASNEVEFLDCNFEMEIPLSAGLEPAAT